MISIGVLFDVVLQDVGRASGINPFILDTDRRLDSTEDIFRAGSGVTFGSSLYKYIATGILGASTDMEADAQKRHIKTKNQDWKIPAGERPLEEQSSYV